MTSFLFLLWLLLLQAGRWQWHPQSVICWVSHLHNIPYYSQIFIKFTNLHDFGLCDVWSEINEESRQSWMVLNIVHKDIAKSLQIVSLKQL